MPYTLALMSTEYVPEDVISQAADAEVGFFGAAIFLQSGLCGQPVERGRDEGGDLRRRSLVGDDARSTVSDAR